MAGACRSYRAEMVLLRGRVGPKRGQRWLFNSLLRYNMESQEIGSRAKRTQREASQVDSEVVDVSEREETEEALVSEEKVAQLNYSLQQLRAFLQTLTEQQIATIPPSVQEYTAHLANCGPKTREEVFRLAEGRLNKMLRNRKIKKNWNTEDVALLVWLVAQQVQSGGYTHFSQLNSSDWQAISNLISGTHWQKCKYRWLSLRKVKLLSHKWSHNESKLLAAAIGSSTRINWKAVSQRLYEFNTATDKVFRTAKQCRQHWNCFLNPNIQKGPWSLQQDRRLLEYVLELEGSKKWSEIAKFMEGRTENALKNRFNLLLSRQRKLAGPCSEKKLVKLCLSRVLLEQAQAETPLPTLPQDSPPAASLPPPALPNALPRSGSAFSSYQTALRSCQEGVDFLQRGSASHPPTAFLPPTAIYFSFLFPAPYHHP